MTTTSFIANHIATNAIAGRYIQRISGETGRNVDRNAIANGDSVCHSRLQVIEARKPPLTLRSMSVQVEWILTLSCDCVGMEFEMPFGPQGRDQFADAMVVATNVAQAIVGSAEISGRAGGKTAGGDARAANPVSDTRASTTRESARAQGSQRENIVMTMQATKGTGADGREAVRMYPDNRLPEQVRDVSETASVFAVVKQAFETNV